MKRDPVGELFGVSNSQPVVIQTTGNGWILPFLLGVAVAFGGMWIRDGGFNHGQRDDDQRQNDEVSVDGGYIVIVWEAQEVTADQELIKRGLPDYVTAKDLSGFRVLDDDQKDAKPFIDYANGRGVSPPLVAYVDSTKKIRKAATFPADYAELEAFLP